MRVGQVYLQELEWVSFQGEGITFKRKKRGKGALQGEAFVFRVGD